MESDFGVAKVEWSAIVVCVCARESLCVHACVTDPSLLQDYIKLGHTHHKVLHSIPLLPL